ncbi:MAG: phage terminase large subunit [Lentisphaeria bacterium]|nr:phage terminase large subunit [Lentisphaeria bacterium]
MRSQNGFKLTAVQRDALKLLGGRSRFVLLFGGSRSGKTFLLVYAVLVRALRAPGSRHIILRFRGNAVRQAVMRDTFPKVIRLAFPGLRYSESRADQFVTLSNQSEIWFGGLDTDEHLDKILGKEFATIYFNECSEISYKAVNTALSRLAQKTSLVNRAYFDCNPAGKSHWSYKLFIEHIDPESSLPLVFPQNYASMLLNPEGNRENLPEGYLEETLAGLSERQRQRFQLGVWLDDMTGALWTFSMLEKCRSAVLPDFFDRVVIGVDPAVTGNRESDETGIVAAARKKDLFYVLDDLSMKGTPAQWAERVADGYRRWEADRVVAEVNNGGDLVECVLRSSSPDISYRAVRAGHGKIARAEPIAALYEQNRVRHAGRFPLLEEQMTGFTADSSSSPDRLDALVWAMHALLTDNPGKRFILS